MTDEEKNTILARAAELRDELMGVGRSATAPVSETGEAEAASAPPATTADSEGSGAGP